MYDCVYDDNKINCINNRNTLSSKLSEHQFPEYAFSSLATGLGVDRWPAKLFLLPKHKYKTQFIIKQLHIIQIFQLPEHCRVFRVHTQVLQLHRLPAASVATNTQPN